MDNVEIAVPSELVTELLQARLAVRPLRRRGGEWAVFASLAIDAASLLVAVVVSRDALTEVARRFARHARRTSAGEVTITVRLALGDETETLTVARSDEGEQQIVVAVTTQLLRRAPAER